MIDNTRTPPPRNGMGCPPDAGVEVLPDDWAPQRTGDIRIGRVTMCRDTTINSPFFWLLVGGTAGALAVYLVLRESRR